MTQPQRLELIRQIHQLRWDVLLQRMYLDEVNQWTTLKTIQHSQKHCNLIGPDAPDDLEDNTESCISYWGLNNYDEWCNGCRSCVSIHLSVRQK